MPAELKINGLNELIQELRRLPPALVRDAGPIVHAQAEEMARQVQAAYGPHRQTGNLESHLSVTLEGGASYATARVKNSAYHAWIFENGTGPRNYNGKNRGVMPAQHVFIPIAIRRRAVMVAALTELVERAGLTVTTTG